RGAGRAFFFALLRQEAYPQGGRYRVKEALRQGAALAAGDTARSRPLSVVRECSGQLAWLLGRAGRALWLQPTAYGLARCGRRARTTALDLKHVPHRRDDVFGIMHR